jgi:hypothetical protein
MWILLAEDGPHAARRLAKGLRERSERALPRGEAAAAPNG